MTDDLEPGTGKYDWQEAFRQNPDQPMFDVPNWMRDRDHGRETAEDARSRAMAEAAEEWSSIAHLEADPDADLTGCPGPLH